jgi:hypothetical protein
LELPAKAKPPTAHISRVTVEEDVHELKIVGTAFHNGAVSEAGLFFISYCRTFEIPRVDDRDCGRFDPFEENLICSARRRWCRTRHRRRTRN